MKFEEDYTEEERELLRQRGIMDQRKKSIIYGVLYRDRINASIKLWRANNAEKLRKYNAEMKRKQRAQRKDYNSPEAIKRAKMKQSLKRVSHWRGRGRVSKEKLMMIYMEIEKQRADKYLDELENGKRKNIIMCIVGGSGTGKTLASLHLKYKLGANVICSFTTRPPRKTEVEGRDHHFIDIVPEKELLLAYTKYGYYKYYALKSQVSGPVTVYVIDENGLLELKKNFGDEYDIRSLYINRKPLLRKIAGVTDQRIERDDTRMASIPMENYDLVIENNGTKASFFEKVEGMYNSLMEEAKKYGWD